MANYLITGYWGQPHVTAENDRGINAGIIGSGRFVLPVGERFKADYIGNNTVRMHDGKLVDNGAAAGIPAGEYIDLLISNARDGMKRNDIIAFQYSQDISTLIESGKFVVIQGEETEGTAVDPELVHADLLSNRATLDQMALWRVSVFGATIAAPVPLFEVSKSLSEVGAYNGSDSSGGDGDGGNSPGVELPEIWPVERGGTGAKTAAQALENLGAAAQRHAHEVSEINGLQTLLSGIPKIACGAYTGIDNASKTLGFDFVPKIVIVTSNSTVNGAFMVLISGVSGAPIFISSGSSETETSFVTVTWEGNSVSWRGNSGYTAANASGAKYNYFAFG